MDKFAAWIREKVNPLVLLLFVFGAVLILLGVTTGLNISVLSQIVPDPSSRAVAIIVGILFCGAAVAVYYRPPPGLVQAKPNQTPSFVPHELTLNFSGRRTILSENQDAILDFIIRNGIGGTYISQDTLENRFGQYSKSELTYRLEQLRLLGFCEAQAIGKDAQGGARYSYRLSEAYRHEIGIPAIIPAIASPAQMQNIPRPLNRADIERAASAEPSTLNMVNATPRDPQPLVFTALGVASDWADRYPDLPAKVTDFFGIPFRLGNPYFDSSRAGARTLQENLPGVTGVIAVYVLINAGNARKIYQQQNLVGTNVGRILLWFRDGASQEVQLRLGFNLREWKPGNFPGELVEEITDPSCRNFWKNSNGTQLVQVIDLLQISIDRRNRAKALDRITVVKDTIRGTPQDVLEFSIYAITLEF